LNKRLVQVYIMSIPFPSTIGECFNLAQQPEQGFWYQSIFFPLLLGGYYPLNPAAQYTVIGVSAAALIFILAMMILKGIRLSRLKRKNVFEGFVPIAGEIFPWIERVLMPSLVMVWQFYINLSNLLMSATGFTTPTSFILMLHFLIEVTMITIFFYKLYSKKVNIRYLVKVAGIIALVFFMYKHAYSSTNQVQIQQRFSLISVLTDLLHPIASGLDGAYFQMGLSLIHFLSFYPTIPFCYMTDIVIIYQTVFIAINLPVMMGYFLFMEKQGYSNVIFSLC
jgi:hypothetical protein